MENIKSFNPERTFNIIVQESDELIYDFALEEKAKFSSLSAVLFAWYNCIYFYLIEESETLYSSLYSALEKYGIEKFTPKFINDYNEFCQNFCQNIFSSENREEKFAGLCSALYLVLKYTTFSCDIEMTEILPYIRDFLTHFSASENLNYLIDNFFNIKQKLTETQQQLDDIVVRTYGNRASSNNSSSNNDNGNAALGCLVFAVGIIVLAVIVILAVSL